MFCSSIKCLQVGCHASWLQNWKNVLLPASNFWNALKQKVMGFLGIIVTGDETWVHYHQLETKIASKEWCHTSSPKPKIFRTQPSAGRVMLTLFWDEQRVILEHYMPRGNTVTSAMYADLLKNHLCPAIKSKRCGLLEYRCFVATRQCSAPYCPFNCCNNPRSVLWVSSTSTVLPDLAPSNFHVFEPLKEAMGGKSFRSDEDVQQAVHKWLRSQPKDFFLEVFMHFWSAGTLLWNAMEIT